MKTMAGEGKYQIKNPMSVCKWLVEQGLLCKKKRMASSYKGEIVVGDHDRPYTEGTGYIK